MTARALASVWQRFLLLGWIGKMLTVAAALYLLGWIVGSLGWHVLARQFGSAALFVLAVLLTALFTRLVWRSSTSPLRA